jgi:hypothetical protein
MTMRALKWEFSAIWAAGVVEPLVSVDYDTSSFPPKVDDPGVFAGGGGQDIRNGVLGFMSGDQDIESKLVDQRHNPLRNQTTLRERKSVRKSPSTREVR